MAKESRFIIVKTAVGEKDKFLRHEGHKQYWSADRRDAMEYTLLDIAQSLAEIHKGRVVAV